MFCPQGISKIYIFIFCITAQVLTSGKEEQKCNQSWYTQFGCEKGQTWNFTLHNPPEVFSELASPEGYTSVTYLLINSLSHPLVLTALQRRHAQTVRDRSYSFKINYVIVIQNFLNLEGHQLFKSSGHFTEGGDFAHRRGSFSGGGSAPAACAAGLFVYIARSSSFFKNNQTK